MALTIRFYIDPGTGEPHIYNHGVDAKSKMFLRAPVKIGPAVKDRGQQSDRPAQADTCG